MKNRCEKCGRRLIYDELIYCIPCADSISGEVPTKDEYEKYYERREDE